MPARRALDLLRSRVGAVAETEDVALDAAPGRFLASAVVSHRDSPSFDNVAVDGFAFAHADLASGVSTRLDLAPGRAAAGHPHGATLRPGSALRVLTGAALPRGADTVVMQEDVTLDGAQVIIPPGRLQLGANRRLIGEDVRTGQRVLEAGCRLRPQDIGAAATAGHAVLEVFRRLRVAVLSTGDELQEPGVPLGSGPEGGTVFDLNRPMLKALLSGLPVEIRDLGILDDSRARIEATLAAAAGEVDAIITTGGASRGDEDHIVPAIARLGHLHLWQIAIKPGRPLAFGQVGDTVFLGLPGNPVAAMICFLLFARPVLTVLGGGRWPEPGRFPVTAGFAFEKKAGRREYLRGALTRTDAGPLAHRIAREGSGILTALVEADGLIELDEDRTRVALGEPVDFLPFESFGLVGG